MSKTKPTHTPAPWIAKQLINHTTQAGNWVILYSAKSGQHMCRLDHAGEFSEDNARLIATAPDLLEALKEARHCLNMSGNQYPSSVEREIDAAIAKAEGRED